MREEYSEVMALIAGSGHPSCPSRALSACLRRLIAIIAAGLFCLTSTNLVAQTNASAPPNRFLFVVETSRAMRPRAAGVFNAMKHALDSSLNGQIRQGDLVGIWTFNESVYQEMFPSQVWSQPTQLAFAVRLPTLANPEIYLKRARLEKVLPEVLKVISESENVTVVFVSSGEGDMQGAPYGAQINSAWKEWHDELEGIHMPLLTALRTRNGQPVDWLLTPAPRPINLPALAADSKPDDEKETNPRGVVLESGLAPKKAETTALPLEQQVAFSIWALGRTGFVASASNAQGAPASKSDSTGAGTPPPGPTTNEQPAQPSEIGENHEHNATQSAATLSKNPSIANPVDLVFETNASVPNSTAHNSTITASKQANTPAVEVPAISTQPRDILTQQLAVHARSVNPGKETRAAAPSLPSSRRSFLRKNINPLVLMIVATFGAAYSFRMWFLTNKRLKGRAVSLTHSTKTELSDRRNAPAPKAGGAGVPAGR